ncbi:MAG: hypothetical protein GXO08_01810 [Aquificae bacterium]|nr:hypothetical protein [Aquificota bacterium]
MRPVLLFGGLTEAHDRLLEATLRGFGYEARRLPTPDNEALRIGKEYCNRGECNPVYYTVGNLLKFLFELRESGVDRIEERFVFVTVGSCGPCRFGMYETEYRKALREAGFENFKVVALDQGRALTEELEEAGVRLTRPLVLALLKAVVIGDLLNDLYYRVKPYEVEKGDTDRWREQSLQKLEGALRAGRDPLPVLKEVWRDLSEVEVDLLRPKPRVKIIGEFFAQTTEGDGNYRLARWLVEEGAEPSVEPVVGWILYLVHQKALEVRIDPEGSKLQKLTRLAKLKLLDLLVRFYYARFRRALGNKPSPLKDPAKLAKLAAPYYHPRLVGGEGFLEVAKHLEAFGNRSADLVVSVKPFGCMPSTQSDGVQAKVVEDLGSLFVSVETSGDAEANAKSRILMKLYEARERALAEFEETKRRLGLTEGRISELLKRKPELRRATAVLPERSSVTAVNALYYLAGA